MGVYCLSLFPLLAACRRRLGEERPVGKRDYSTSEREQPG